MDRRNDDQSNNSSVRQIKVADLVNSSFQLPDQPSSAPSGVFDRMRQKAPSIRRYSFSLMSSSSKLPDGSNSRRSNSTAETSSTNNADDNSPQSGSLSIAHTSNHSPNRSNSLHSDQVSSTSISPVVDAIDGVGHDATEIDTTLTNRSSLLPPPPPTIQSAPNESPALTHRKANSLLYNLLVSSQRDTGVVDESIAASQEDANSSHTSPHPDPKPAVLDKLVASTSLSKTLGNKSDSIVDKLSKNNDSDLHLVTSNSKTFSISDPIHRPRTNSTTRANGIDSSILNPVSPLRRFSAPAQQYNSNKSNKRRFTAVGNDREAKRQCSFNEPIGTLNRNGSNSTTIDLDHLVGQQHVVNGNINHPSVFKFLPPPSTRTIDRVADEPIDLTGGCISTSSTITTQYHPSPMMMNVGYCMSNSVNFTVSAPLPPCEQRAPCDGEGVVMQLAHKTSYYVKPHVDKWLKESLHYTCTTIALIIRNYRLSSNVSTPQPPLGPTTPLGSLLRVDPDWSVNWIKPASECWHRLLVTHMIEHDIYLVFAKRQATSDDVKQCQLSMGQQSTSLVDLNATDDHHKSIPWLFFDVIDEKSTQPDLSFTKTLESCMEDFRKLSLKSDEMSALRLLIVLTALDPGALVKSVSCFFKLSDPSPLDYCMQNFYTKSITNCLTTSYQPRTSIEELTIFQSAVGKLITLAPGKMAGLLCRYQSLQGSARRPSSFASVPLLDKEFIWQLNLEYYLPAVTMTNDISDSNVTTDQQSSTASQSIPSGQQSVDHFVNDTTIPEVRVPTGVAPNESSAVSRPLSILEKLFDQA